MEKQFKYSVDFNKQFPHQGTVKYVINVTVEKQAIGSYGINSNGYYCEYGHINTSEDSTETECKMNLFNYKHRCEVDLTDNTITCKMPKSRVMVYYLKNASLVMMKDYDPSKISSAIPDYCNKGTTYSVVIGYIHGPGVILYRGECANPDTFSLNFDTGMMHTGYASYISGEDLTPVLCVQDFGYKGGKWVPC